MYKWVYQANEKNMKNKGSKKMEKQENKFTIDDIGREINQRLSSHFNQWRAGLQFRFVMSSQAYRAKALGMDVGSMAHKLEESGYIKILNTPNGQRFVFAGDCPMTIEEMQNWLQEQEMIKESQKELKKMSRA